MKYIAIRTNDFILINQDHNENELIAQGYILYTLEEYNQYIIQNSQMNQADSLLLLESKAEEYIAHGEILWREVRRKVWALNTYNISTGVIITKEDMLSLFSMSHDLERSLLTGSFKTAIDVCTLLKTSLPQYTSVADYTINSLKSFMGLV